MLLISILFIIKNFFICLIVNYEIETPKEFDYNYDPKQDDESESDDERLVPKYKKYAKKRYNQFKKEISNHLE
jgi:hypothetical protein